MKRKLSSGLTVCLMIAALAGGCKKEAPAPPPPPKKPSESPKPAGPAGQPAAAVQKQLSSATRQGSPFDFSKKTDPFKPWAPPAAPAPVQVQAAPNAAPAAPPADLLPIQSFEVAKFKVVGIIAGLRENRALVVDPNGKGYVVQEGMQIGNNNGRISKITANAVEVVERVKEGTRYRQKKIVLTLAKKR